ncbi:hypothetical protein [Bacillus sp. 2205SS5-2]|uniref:hypothetical protein n=1 Tax=Bacillus sp. 2205SS5-2 TaxID=3109031 RepID=UPI003004201A
MLEKLNTYSFILSLLCLAMFFFLSFPSMFHYSEKTLNFHPLYLILGLIFFSFFLGLLGFAGVKDGKSLVRSITTMIISIVLASFLVWVIGIGHFIS